jgi:hypothetical protein
MFLLNMFYLVYLYDNKLNIFLSSIQNYNLQISILPILLYDLNTFINHRLERINPVINWF